MLFLPTLVPLSLGPLHSPASCIALHCEKELRYPSFLANTHTSLTMKLVPSFLSPVPSFPNYTGPYSVGTLDVEIPTTELPSPAPAPVPTITTISFRVFYPCEVPAKEPKPVFWISDPQPQVLAALLRFLGASPGLAECAS